MKTLYIWIVVALCACGCTSFHVVQTDGTPGQSVRTTDLRATAWFSSAQNLAKIKAFQSDKTQSFGSDNVTQQGATNVVAALEAIVKILQAVRPTP